MLWHYLLGVRKRIRSVKKLSADVLLGLSVWGEVPMIRIMVQLIARQLNGGHFESTFVKHDFWLNYSLYCNIDNLLFLNRVQRTFSSSSSSSDSDDDSSACRPLPPPPSSKSSTGGLGAASTSRVPPLTPPDQLPTRHSPRKPAQPSATPKRPLSHRSPDKFSIPPPPSSSTTPRLSAERSTPLAQRE